MDNSKRINYYIGKLKKNKYDIIYYNKTFTCEYNKKYYKNGWLNFIQIFCINKNFQFDKLYSYSLDEHKHTHDNSDLEVERYNMIFDYIKQNYIVPIIDLFNSDSLFKECNFLHRPDDVFFHCDIPILTKTRPIGESYNILLKIFDQERHWGMVSKIHTLDTEYHSKNNKLIWRGCSNGFLLSEDRPSRLTLCKKFYNHENKMIDIGFSDVTLPEYNIYIKNRMTIEEQLKSKFIISLEGGDVGTSLKWLLASNSTVIMPKPTMVSWLMEDKLEPWIHYVPINKNYDNLIEIYEWCSNNINKCEIIAHNGKMYMQQFMNEDNEILIQKEILKEYNKYVNINEIN